MKNTFTLIASALLLVSCGTKRTGPQMPPLKLHVVTAEQMNLAHRETFTGQTAPLHSYVIQPRVNGYLQRIDYTSGSKVSKGRRLFVIDPSPYTAELAREQANLASAKAQLTQATNEYNRNVPLARINAVSQSQLDASKAQLESARESVAAAMAVVKSAKLNVGYTVIVSPGEGIVAQTSAVEGDYVGPGTEFEVLTTVADNDSIIVNLSLPTAKYYNIAGVKTLSGDTLLSNINLLLPDGTLYPKKGKYRFTQQNIDNQSGSVVFQVAFDNKDGVLRSGEFVRVSADIGTPVGRVLIPQSCVDQTQGLYSVWVIKPDNSAEYRSVTVGNTFDTLWEITSGLKAGERVTMEGFAKLHGGMKVEPIEK